MFQAQGTVTRLHTAAQCRHSRCHGPASRALPTRHELQGDLDSESGKPPAQARHMGHDSGGSGLRLTCSALLARAMMLAGSPALTMQDTSAEGMDSLGTMVISYRSRVLREAMGSASTVHLPEYSCTRRRTAPV